MVKSFSSFNSSARELREQGEDHIAKQSEQCLQEELCPVY